jgi:hypothetical protein
MILVHSVNEKLNILDENSYAGDVTYSMVYFKEHSLVYLLKQGRCILFSVVFTPSPLATTAVFGSFTVISLFLTNTVSSVWLACLVI